MPRRQVTLTWDALFKRDRCALQTGGYGGVALLRATATSEKHFITFNCRTAVRTNCVRHPRRRTETSSWLYGTNGR